MKRKCVKFRRSFLYFFFLHIYYKMSKSDVSKPVASDPTQQIVLTFEDVLPENSDGTIKIKKVSEFLGADIKTLKIIGHNTSYFHNDVTHHELTFVIKDKKTKVIDKLVIDFVQKPNQKKFKGVVSLATDAASSTRTEDPFIEIGPILFKPGTQVTATYSEYVDGDSLRCATGEEGCKVVYKMALNF